MLDKVSIIMPVYNKRKYLQKSVESILNQTYKDIELILIDDGSTDGSEKICDELKRLSNKILVFHIKNGGVSNARNIGIEKSSGKYIQFVDADDYLEKDSIENLIVIMEKYNPDFILSGIKKINNRNEVINKIIPKLNGLKTKEEMLSVLGEEQRKTGIYGCVSNKFIKKSIIESFNLKFNINIKLAEDLDFYLNLYEVSSKIYFYQSAFYFYLQNAENSSSDENIEVDYFTQILINLKQKNLIESLKKDSSEVCITITGFVLCYIYSVFRFSYLNFREKINKIKDNLNIIKSLSFRERKVFDKIIVFFISKKLLFLIYIFIGTKIGLKKIYRKIKKET